MLLLFWHRVQILGGSSTEADGQTSAVLAREAGFLTQAAGLAATEAALGLNRALLPVAVSGRASDSARLALATALTARANGVAHTESRAAPQEPQLVRVSITAGAGADVRVMAMEGI